MSDIRRVVFVDNVDSFTHNLVDEFARRDLAVEVWRNTTAVDRVLARARGLRPSLIVISPGPGHPREAVRCFELIERAAGEIPIFGVCLGHQIIVEAFGGAVERAPQLLHGKTSSIVHEGGMLFDGIPSPVRVGRYHSLAASRVPPALRVTARADDGTVMAVEHIDQPIAGVQFHPESILTVEGSLLIDNVLRWAGRW